MLKIIVFGITKNKTNFAHFGGLKKYQTEYQIFFLAIGL